MSKLMGALTCNGPIIDKRLEGKLFVLSTTPIDEDIKRLLALSFWSVAEQLEHEDLLQKLARINCFITKYGEVTIQLDEDQEGCHISIAIYPVQKWKDYNRTDLQILTCIIEELCHHFWNIEDEIAVNYKVLEIIKRINLEIEMQDLYSVEWMNQNET